MPLKLNSSGGGSVTLDVPATASPFALTIPAKTGNLITSADTGTVSQAMMGTNVGPTGPAFSAVGSGQVISNITFTKITNYSESFDTASAFNPTTGVFTPLVAGYYQFTFQFSTNQSAGAVFAEVRKNNVRVFISGITPFSTGVGAVASGSGLFYMNGSTDYAEMFVYQNSGGAATTDTSTIFCGFLARAG